MGGQRHSHSGGVVLPQPSRPLYIREQKRHGPRRTRLHQYLPLTPKLSHNRTRQAADASARPAEPPIESNRATSTLDPGSRNPP